MERSRRRGRGRATEEAVEVTALGSLLLASERHGRELGDWNQTNMRILVATFDAKLAHSDPSIRQIAAAGGLHRGHREVLPLALPRARRRDGRDRRRSLLLDRIWDRPDGAPA